MRKFSRAIFSADSEISRNITSSIRSAHDTQIIPEPVPISTIVFIFCDRILFLARLMSHSVSSLGMRTSGVTINSRPKKVTFPAMYSSG